MERASLRQVTEQQWLSFFCKALVKQRRFHRDIMGYHQLYIHFKGKPTEKSLEHLDIDPEKIWKQRPQNERGKRRAGAPAFLEDFTPGEGPGRSLGVAGIERGSQEEPVVMAAGVIFMAIFMVH